MSSYIAARINNAIREVEIARWVVCLEKDIELPSGCLLSDKRTDIFDDVI